MKTDMKTNISLLGPIVIKRKLSSDVQTYKKIMKIRSSVPEVGVDIQ